MSEQKLQLNWKPLIPGIIAWSVVLIMIFVSRDWTVKSFIDDLMSSSSNTGSLNFIEETKKIGLSNYRFKLPDLTDKESANVNPRESSLRGEYILGPGIAIADFNSDGFMDIFLPGGHHPAKNKLFINQNGNFFIDEADKWGIAEANGTKSTSLAPVIIDYNTDGLPDLFIAGIGCNQLYKNKGGFFENESLNSGLADCKNSQGGVVVDPNHDGIPDLFVFRYFPEFEFFNPNAKFVWPENTYAANNGGQDSLYLNSENGKFSDSTQQWMPQSTGWAIDANYGDMRNQGKMNIYVANDFGPDFLFEENGDHFINLNRKLGIPDRRYGMNVSFVDLDASGKPHIYISNVFYPRYNERGNFLWQFDSKGKAHDHAVKFGVDNCLFAWGGAFGDFNLDGKIDLYVANGYVSKGGKRKSGDGFVVATFVGMPGVMTSHLSILDREKIPFRSANQVDCLFINDGKEFNNVSKKSGITKPWDGRVVATIDAKNNGVLDLIVTTRPGYVHYLKNQQPVSKKWIGFTPKSKDVKYIGSRLEVRQGSYTSFRWHTAGKSGFLAYSDPRFHFGLPTEDPVDVIVHLTNGKKIEYTGLTVGQYYPLEEL